MYGNDFFCRVAQKHTICSWPYNVHSGSLLKPCYKRKLQAMIIERSNRSASALFLASIWCCCFDVFICCALLQLLVVLPISMLFSVLVAMFRWNGYKLVLNAFIYSNLSSILLHPLAWFFFHFYSLSLSFTINSWPTPLLSFLFMWSLQAGCNRLNIYIWDRENKKYGRVQVLLCNRATRPKETLFFVIV